MTMEELKNLYTVECLSVPQIATQLGWPRSTVRKRLVDSGVTFRTRADGVRLRAAALGTGWRGKKRPPFSEQHCANISKGRTAWGNANAVGTSVKPSGYVEYTRGPHKGRHVHTVIMETRLGRRLRADEQVHHVNRDRADNDEDNLALLTAAGHARLHRYEEALERGVPDVNG